MTDCASITATIGACAARQAFHGGVIATLIDLAGHAVVAVKIGKIAPTIDLRIDYLRPSTGESIIARARLLKAGSMLGCLVPGLDGAFLSRNSKDALWDSFTRLRHHDGGNPSSNTK